MTAQMTDFLAAKCPPRVLLVDADPRRVDAVTQFLRSRHAKVSAAQSFSSLSSYLETQRPTILLLDAEMPGLDVFALVRRVRDNPQSAGTILLLHSNLAEEALARLARECGANGYVAKARGVRYLQQHLEWWLSMPGWDLSTVIAMEDGMLDEQPFGIVRLDPEGVVLSYNLYEAQLARRKREDVIGKNWFKEVAPCTAVQSFYGRFRAGIERRKLSESFEFVFPFPHEARKVDISLYYKDADSSVWVMVRG